MNYARRRVKEPKFLCHFHFELHPSFGDSFLLQIWQLMENLIPVVEKRRPPRVLRRVNSVQW
uniref:Uncharacterized protein n=1 Tax=Manihot esculenta TaxID=3983 RepID=A0A2C9W2E4_MANES